MMDICFPSALILLLFIFVKVLSFLIFCFVIGVLDLGVSFGMVGCLLLLVLVELPLGPPLLRTLLVLGWRGCWVLILKEIVENGSLLIILLMVLSLLMFLIILMFGLMVALFLMSYPVLELVGLVVYSLRSGAGWFGRRWGHRELLPPGDLGVERCVLFDSIRGPLQSVQRAELWGVILTLQCSSAVHLGVDNLNVVRHVSRILEGRVPGKPLELTFDGDLLIIIERMIQVRGVQSTEVSKVKGSC